MNPGNQRSSCLGTILTALAMVGSAFARLPAAAPALPPPDNLTVIQVDTAQALADACWNLQSNQAIVIAPGTYDLASVAFPNGEDGRLTVGRFGAQPISNIQIRGATGDPSDVVLHGSGMLDPIVPHGIQLFTATDVTIADLSIRDVYYHAVMVSGSTGARDVRLYNIRAYDIGQQIIKGSGAGADDVVIEYSELLANSPFSCLESRRRRPFADFANFAVIGSSAWRRSRRTAAHGLVSTTKENGWPVPTDGSTSQLA